MHIAVAHIGWRIVARLKERMWKTYGTIKTIVRKLILICQPHRLRRIFRDDFAPAGMPRFNKTYDFIVVDCFYGAPFISRARLAYSFSVSPRVCMARHTHTHTHTIRVMRWNFVNSIVERLHWKSKWIADVGALILQSFCFQFSKMPKPTTN